MKKASITKRVLGLCMASALCGGMLLSGMGEGITAMAAGDMRVVYNVNLPENTTWPDDGVMPVDTEADAQTGKAVIGDDPSPLEIQDADGKWFAFQGWKKDDGEDLLEKGDTVQFDTEEAADQRTVLYAQWDVAKVGVTISFIDDGGREITSATQTIVTAKGTEYDVSAQVKQLPTGYAPNGDLKGDPVKGIADSDKKIIVPLKPFSQTELFITVSGNTATLPYNGKEQSVSGYTFEVKDKDGNAIHLPEGLGIAPDGTKYVAKGTEISDDAYAMGIDVMDLELTGEDTWMYRPTFTVYDGWVKIVNGSGLTAKADPVTVSAYDGKEHPVTVDVKVNNEPTASATTKIVYKDDRGAVIEGAPKDAGGYKAEITVSQEGFDDVTLTTSVTIGKAGLTVKTDSATKDYDGNALKNANATVTGAVNGETVSIEATGAQTGEGSSKNTYKLTYSNGAKEGNYYVAKEDLGTLTVNKKAQQNNNTQNNNTQSSNNTQNNNQSNTQTSNRNPSTSQNQTSQNQASQNTTDVKYDTVKTADTSYPIALFAALTLIFGAGYVLYTKREA